MFSRAQINTRGAKWETKKNRGLCILYCLLTGCIWAPPELKHPSKLLVSNQKSPLPDAARCSRPCWPLTLVLRLSPGINLVSNHCLHESVSLSPRLSLLQLSLSCCTHQATIVLLWFQQFSLWLSNSFPPSASFPQHARPVSGRDKLVSSYTRIIYRKSLESLSPSAG